MNLYAMKNATSNPSTRGGTIDPDNAAHRAARAASAEVARQRQRLAAARRLSAALAPLLDARDIAQATIDELSASFGWFLVVMHKLEDDGMLRVQAAAGEMAEQLGDEVLNWARSADSGVNGRAVRTGEPVIVPDTRADPDFLKPEGDDMWAGSELAVPIRVAGEVWGVLDLEDRETDAFGPDDLVFADLLAGHIGAALDRSRLYHELEDTFITTLAMLSDALERKDAYTAAHADEVAGPERRRRPPPGPARVRGQDDQLRRAAARRRQDRHPQRDPAEAGGADRGGVRGDQAAHADRRRHAERDPVLRGCRAARPLGARALGRPRLPGRAVG